MTLAELLFGQGFGTRRECAALIASGEVLVQGRTAVDAGQKIEPDGIELVVRGLPWHCRERAVLVMNKPSGYECSLKPRHHPSVYALLPAPLRRRGVQAVGRLDADTTGVLLFTDDGALIHRLTSPKHRVAKVYEATCKHAVDDDQIAQLRTGVLLHDDVRPVRAEACEATGQRTLRMTLTEGKYHQVKRMVAAAGNRIEQLHRSALGPVRIDSIALGGWRWLARTEEEALERPL